MKEGPEFEAYLAEWLYGDRKGDEGLSRALAAECRGAWSMGGDHNRIAVLTYIVRSDRADLFDLVAEGLRDESNEIAFHAAAVASALVDRYPEFGKGIRGSLQALRVRLPERRSVIDYALALIDKGEQESS